MLTVLLIMGMEVIDDLTHAFEGEIIRIKSENSPPIHVICGKLAFGLAYINDRRYQCRSTWSREEFQPCSISQLRRQHQRNLGWYVRGERHA